MHIAAAYQKNIITIWGNTTPQLGMYPYIPSNKNKYINIEVKGLPCRINLIRFHAIPGVPLEGVEMDKMVAFRDYLTQHGVFTTIRASRGEDIWAACGMLSTMRKEERGGTR